MSNFDPQSKLSLVKLGNQAGILKIVSLDREVLFIKKRPNSSFEGLNDTTFAPVTDEDSANILSVLGIDLTPEGLSGALSRITAQIDDLPRSEALCVAGVIGSRQELKKETLQAVRKFLDDQIIAAKSGLEKRYAVLALGLCREIDFFTVDRVTSFYEADPNLFETFSVQQFFAMQADKVKDLPQIEDIRTRVSAVDSLYRDNIVASLK